MDYVRIVSQMFAGKNCYVDDLDEKRIEIHEKILDAFGFDGMRIAGICSRLDIWLGFPNTDKAFSVVQVERFGKKLYDLLTSDFVKNGSWADVEDEYKRLRDSWHDDLNFDGWKEKDNG